MTCVSGKWTFCTSWARGKGGGGGAVIGLMFAGYVPLASQSPYPIIVYFLGSYRPILSLFGKCNFRDPNLVTFYLYIYLYQCGFKRRNVQCELIVKFNKQELSDFLTENLPILNPYSAQKFENLRPHSRNSIENATPLQSIPS